ncbi:MAG TPA: right-handed parallel beta-helix repeat-containing protein [Thermoanaerobaculia bacterium]|nr:right-handed parallel beta-helix repeat-containing protein [Thermoanaerobaculia bacterium]
MKRNRILSGLTCAILLLAFGTAAEAQATRTWVSGVGDDANPCSRTAPCKTFAGAISKTATGGIINALDSGGFGGVTITKSITIDGSHSLAGALVSGTNAIVVNAPSTAVVVLRGLNIDGIGTGLNGIRFLAGAALHVENCVINGFTGKALDIEPTTTTSLFVTNTVIRNNTGASAGGILLKPSGVGSVKATFQNVIVNRNTFGLRAETNTETTIRSSSFSGSTAIGVEAFTPGGNVQINLDETTVANNVSHGIQTSGAGAVVRISNVQVINNIGTGLVPGTGQILSFGNNRVTANTGGNGAPSGAVIPQV